MVDFAQAVLPGEEDIQAVLAAATGAQEAQALVQGVEAARRPFVFRSLAWLVKLGVLRVAA